MAGNNATDNAELFTAIERTRVMKAMRNHMFEKPNLGMVLVALEKAWASSSLRDTVYCQILLGE